MKKTLSVLLVAIVVSSMMFAHPASAHNFVKNSDAELIAKIQEFKVESKLIADNVGNSTIAQWHESQSEVYWGTNEMGVLYQKDANLANQISTAIDDLYSYAGQQGADSVTANQKADAINNLLDKAEAELVNPSSETNATVQALATVYVLNEVLTDYGNAIDSKVDLTNMNNMNMSAMSAPSSGTMSGMSSSSAPIVNMAAYQSAQAMAGTALTMFNNLKSTAPPSASVYLDKAGTALNQLNQQINSKESGNNVMLTVHMHIHPNLISAFNIAAAPEFPLPLLLAMLSFLGVIVLSRTFYRNQTSPI